jgi:BioD-like phosphotransacetylase family protein
MPSIYVTSPRPGEGKTTVAAGLLQVLGRRGVQSYRRQGDDEATAWLRRALGLVDAAEAAIVEGDGPAPAGTATLVVAAFRGRGTADAVAAASAGALGVILTAVPREQGRFVQRELRPAIEAAGLRVLGELPEERALRAATVGELAAFLQGEVVAGRDYLDNEFQSVMIGAMSHQGGTALPYFTRMEKKIVVTGGDRIDVHMGALGTPTQAIVATGGFAPDPVVVERAEAESCPIIAVLPETPDTLEQIGRFFEQVRFRHESKVRVAAELIRQYVDLAPIESALGLPAPAGVS